MVSDFRTAQSQGASARDRKMLRFISGIFTKSTPVATSATIVTPVYSTIQRESSEEEGRRTWLSHPYTTQTLR